MNSPIVQALQTFTANQLAGSARPYEIDISSLAVNAWQANAFMPSNGLIRPTQLNQNGFVFTTAAAGQTGQDEPAWPSTLGGTVVDGSLTWTAAAPHASSEDAISTVTWSQVNPPDGTLTISSQSNTALTATALVGGGTSGGTYTVKAAITMTSGAIYPVQIIVTVL